MKSKVLLFITAIALLSFPKVNFGQTAPRLGTTSSFALFTGTGASFTNIGASVVTGDIGASTATTFNFTGGTLNGNTYLPGSPMAASAAADVLIAYSDLTGTACSSGSSFSLGTTFGNQTLTPGVYCTVGAAALNGDLTLDGVCNANALFIIKINGAL